MPAQAQTGLAEKAGASELEADRPAGDLAWLMTRESVETRRLSRAAIEVLAIIAYHQPVTRAEIEEIPGYDGHAKIDRPSQDPIAPPPEDPDVPETPFEKVLRELPYLPATYDETYAYLVPCDPKSLYCIWEVGTEARKALKARFVDAVLRADRLGIDAIEVHAAHGYLLHQFLSPIANRREDEYGGSLENRMRWPLEVIAAMRAAWPAHKPLGVRLSATDWLEHLPAAERFDLPDAIEFSQRCAALGADWIDASSGGISPQQKVKVGPGYQVPFAEAIRRETKLPVIAVGMITEPQQAEDIVASGKADMVALARGILYDPHWPWRAAAALGASVEAPRQYWRSRPREHPQLFGPAARS